MNRECLMRTIKYAAVTVTVFAIAFMLSACSVSSKRTLIKYANEHYGACSFIREEHNGTGNDEVRKVYLKDKETGIKYSVTSSMYDFNIDGSSFGYANNISSDFEKAYTEYLLSDAQSDISEIERENGCTIEYGMKFVKITFISRVEVDTAYNVAQKCDRILASYDVKDMRPAEYLLYAEETAYLGYYNAGNASGQTSNTYTVIDYVHKNYDKDAVYLDSLGAYANQFLSYEEIDKIFPDRKGMPMGTAYYFRDKDGDTFIAIYMKDFGSKSEEIRLFRDMSHGMEEIK